MIVTRKDLFEFNLILTEDEFNDIKVVADYDKIPIDMVLFNIIQHSFSVLRNGKDEKET